MVAGLRELKILNAFALLLVGCSQLRRSCCLNEGGKLRKHKPVVILLMFPVLLVGHKALNRVQQFASLILLSG